MTTGIIIGFAIGVSVATIAWSKLMINSSKKQSASNKRIEDLLIRKAEGIERIADILEGK